MTTQSTKTTQIITEAANGNILSQEEALNLAEAADLDVLMSAASTIRDRSYAEIVTYSRKVFIPLTQLCRDVCHYCTFSQSPKKIVQPYMLMDQMLEVARRGVKTGCKEVLFTLGDKPERRYTAAQNALGELGYETTLEYLRDAADCVYSETGLLPHLNPGVMTVADLEMLRPVAPSMGLMLESASRRLTQKGLPHAGSPDKDPAVRIETIRLAGEKKIPFTTGILIGIGETRQERIESLLIIRDLHRRYGHIQEVIIQNFRAKAGTKMAEAPEPDTDELLWTIAVARLVLDPEISLQAPPNLSPHTSGKLIRAGINDWGGISPITMDYVNPERPWPIIEELAEQTSLEGKQLCERLTVYPFYIRNRNVWIDPCLHKSLLHIVDTDGLPRTDGWYAGSLATPPAEVCEQIRSSSISSNNGELKRILDKACSGVELAESEIVRLFSTRGRAMAMVCAAADELRKAVNDDIVTYVVNRNINYTNMCFYHCRFCAFSKGRTSEDLRGPAYNLGTDDLVDLVKDAWHRGATEVCMQGGIHPEYTGETYLRILKAAKAAVPQIHIHAFSPLEIWQGAQTLGLDLDQYLRALKDGGLSTLPGTAAEILDDEVRSILCPDKLNTQQWQTVMETAHSVGLKSTATIMFGHVDSTHHWARHLLIIRRLQERTGGFTEFVPLPFVHMEAPMYKKWGARRGPTFREAILMHAVARLVLHPHIKNIQTSWVKMGYEGASLCLHSGCNDLGGTLMYESISRSAGAKHGQETTPEMMQSLIFAADRTPRQRNTLYELVDNVKETELI